MMLTLGVSRPTPASSSETAALLDRLEIWDTPALTALVLGLLALIRSSVTAQRRWRRTFCLAPRLPNEIGYEKRETASFVGWPQLAASLRSGLSREPRSGNGF